MKCNKCGQEAKDSDLFCKKCGIKLAEEISNKLPDDKQNIPSNDGELLYIHGAKLKNVKKREEQSFNFNRDYNNNYYKDNIIKNKDFSKKNNSPLMLIIVIVITIFLSLGIIGLRNAKRFNFAIYGSWKSEIAKFNFKKPNGKKLEFSWFQNNNTSFSGTYNIWAYEQKEKYLEKEASLEFAQLIKRIKDEKNAKDNNVYILKLNINNYFDGEKDIAKADLSWIVGVIVYGEKQKKMVILPIVKGVPQGEDYFREFEKGE